MARKRADIAKRRKPTESKTPFENFWEPYLAEIDKLRPHPMACAIIGVDDAAYAAWIGRYPLLCEEAKRRAALAHAAALDSIQAGEQGWQAKMRLLESLDPATWIRASSAGRKSNDVSPYSSAIGKRRGKS